MAERVSAPQREKFELPKRALSVKPESFTGRITRANLDHVAQRDRLWWHLAPFVE